MTQDTYALATGEKASRRLDIQNETLSIHSHEHLRKAGLSQGQTVWDIGCGNGAMTVYLAKEVGKTGKVYALDGSAEQLVVAKDKINAEGLENVTFFHGDIRSPQDLPLGVADITYTRFVLMHLTDPEVAVAATLSLLKNGGVALSQESIMGTSYSSSNHEVFSDYRETVIALGKTLGVDYNIGKRSHVLYEQAGYINASVYYAQQKVDLDHIKKVLPLGLAEWEGRAIAAGLLTADKAEKWKMIIKNWPDDTDFFYALPKQAYVTAWKEP